MLELNCNWMTAFKVHCLREIPHKGIQRQNLPKYT